MKRADRSKINKDDEHRPSASKKASRKKTKKPKDCPQRPLSAYNIFFKRERARLLEAREAGNSTGIGDSKAAELFAAMGKTIAKHWRALTPEQMTIYTAAAGEDMKRYRSEMDAYNTKVANEAAKEKEEALKSAIKLSETERQDVICSDMNLATSSMMLTDLSLFGVPFHQQHQLQFLQQQQQQLREMQHRQHLQQLQQVVPAPDQLLQLHQLQQHQGQLINHNAMFLQQQYVSAAVQQEQANLVASMQSQQQNNRMSALQAMLLQQSQMREQQSGQEDEKPN